MKINKEIKNKDDRIDKLMKETLFVCKRKKKILIHMNLDRSRPVKKEA